MREKKKKRKKKSWWIVVCMSACVSHKNVRDVCEEVGIYNIVCRLHFFWMDHPFVQSERPKKGPRIETIRLFVAYINYLHSRVCVCTWYCGSVYKRPTYSYCACTVVPPFLFKGSSIRPIGKTPKREPG
jgi:hypothetical protein